MGDNVGGGVSEPGITEGDYTSWVHKWTVTLDENMTVSSEIVYGATLIDESNNTITVFSGDFYGVLTIYDLETGNILEQTSLTENYTMYTSIEAGVGIIMGSAHIGYEYRGDASRSLQTYYLFMRWRDYPTSNCRCYIEVWRGSNKLWGHNIRDEVAGATVATGEISLTGKYALICTGSKLILYEGN